MAQYTIYALACVKEGKAYIGCTSSLKDRLRSHLSDLRNGTHKNCGLQLAYNSHSPEDFRAVIVDRTDDFDEARKEEYKWIAKLGDRAYNVIRKPGPSTITVPEFDVHQIMDLVRQGLCDEEIAEDLSILPIMAKTVRESPMREYL